MKISELKKILELNGFWLKRQNKHPIYTDGKSIIVMPSGGPTVEPRLSKKLTLDIRKAIARRAQP